MRKKININNSMQGQTSFFFQMFKRKEALETAKPYVASLFQIVNRLENNQSNFKRITNITKKLWQRDQYLYDLNIYLTYLFATTNLFAEDLNQSLLFLEKIVKLQDTAHITECLDYTADISILELFPSSSLIKFINRLIDQTDDPLYILKEIYLYGVFGFNISFLIKNEEKIVKREQIPIPKKIKNFNIEAILVDKNKTKRALDYLLKNNFSFTIERINEYFQKEIERQRLDEYKPVIDKLFNRIKQEKKNITDVSNLSFSLDKTLHKENFKFLAFYLFEFISKEKDLKTLTSKIKNIDNYVFNNTYVE